MISMGRAAKNRIYLLTLYGKNIKDDLISSERKAWKRVLEEIENGST
ncbi:MAG: addiction module toxin RelE [Gammaproteobacteria bacterium]|nr:addiction module toxin RelE [Gammaproteobacteria bacterium]